MSKAKLKSTMPGHTRKRLTREKVTVLMGTRKYAVPPQLLAKLTKELEPHLEQEAVLSFDEFLSSASQKLPQWASHLRGLRYRENMTQVQFAAAIGIPQSNLSAMEHGKRPIGKELAKRIAKAFATDYRYFL